MYTEENEFNYDDYLDEESNYNKKSFFNLGFILKVIAIILLIILIIFLVFKIKNRNIANNGKDELINAINSSETVINDNIKLIRDASHVYFFEHDNLPTNLSELNEVNVAELIDNKLIVSLKDSKGKVCSYNTSGSTIEKNQNDYKLTVKLFCTEEQEEKSFYYDLDGNCLTCNGELYNSSDNDISSESKEEIRENETTNSEDTDENNNQTSNNSKNENDNSQTRSSNVCGVYSDWTSNYKNDANLEVESRVLVKAYKNEPIYGEWVEAGTNEIQGNANLEVRTYQVDEVETLKNCSDESTTKPKAIEGREIIKRVDTKTSTKKVCSGGKTYTKTLTKWDNNAYSCKSYGIGKVVCTYKTKKTCTNKTTTKNIVYYSYCDTITKNVTKTHYQTRTVNYNKIYTDYILENEIPNGYVKIDGSEITQYRYREKCGK